MLPLWMPKNVTTNIHKAIFRVFYVRCLQISYYSVIFIESSEDFDTRYVEMVPHWDCIGPILGINQSLIRTQEQYNCCIIVGFYVKHLVVSELFSIFAG